MKHQKTASKAAISQLLISIILTTYCSVSIGQDTSGTYISTGQSDGLYFHTGSKLSELTTSRFGEESAQRIVVISTGGSKDNLNNLLSGDTELAIVQSDVLFGEIDQIDSYNGTPTELFAIASLFSEYTQILVNKNSGYEKIIQLAGRKIYIGQIGSGTEINAAAILEASGVGQNDYHRVNPGSIKSTNQALSAICKGEIAAAIVVAGSIYPKLEMWRGCLKLLDVDSFTRSALIRKYPYYGFTSITSDGVLTSLLYTRAVLVGSKKLEKKYLSTDIYELTRIVTEDLPAAFQIGLENHNASLYRGPKIVAGLPINFHSVSEEFFKNAGFLKSNRWKWIITLFLFWVTVSIVKLHLGSRSPQEELMYAKRDKTFCFACEVTLGQVQWLFWLGFQGLSKLGKSILDLSFFKSPMMIALYGFVIFLWSAMLLILHFENEYFLTRDISNQFENLEVSEFIIWLLQIVTLGASSNGILPNSFGARTVTVAIPIIGAVGAILAVIVATLKEKSTRERQARGLEVPTLSDHIIMCGWNNRGIRIAKELTTVLPGARPKHLVVLAEIDQEKPLEFFGLKHDSIHYLRGMSSDPESLEKAHASKAKEFVVLAGEKKIGQRNFRSIFTVEMIEGLFEKQKEEKPRIVVDMVFEQNLKMFIHAGADRVINTREIGNIFLAFSSFNMGFSNLVTNLMSLVSRPVISRINMSSRKKTISSVAGLNFSKAWNTLFKSGLNLLAIYPHGGHTSPIKGLHPPLIDPVISGEEDHLITTKDSLVVLENQALSYKSVNAERYTDCQSDALRGLSASTPIILIDRNEFPDVHLRNMLMQKCEDVFHISCAKNKGEAAKAGVTIWNGNVDSITGLIRSTVIPALKREGKSVEKTKCVIPSMIDYSGNNSIGAIHLDDGTIALIIKLKTMAEIEIHFIAEIQCPSNLKLFKAAGVQQPIPVHEFTSLALSKVALFGGEVLGLVLRLMQNYFWENLEDKSLRKMSVQDTGIAGEIVGLNYEGAAQRLFDVGIQLIAIISCDLEVTALPCAGDEDYSYEIQFEDELFVIA